MLLLESSSRVHFIERLESIFNAVHSDRNA